MATKKHLTRVQARAIEILQGARAALKKYGWVQSVYGSVNGGFCALGALRHSAKQRESRAHTLARKALDVVANRYGFSSIPRYNDSDGRTRGEVLRAFRSAEKEVTNIPRIN